MPGVSVNVQPAILDWAMQKAQMGNAGSSVIEMIAKWISGEKAPTFNQIEDVSKKISIPFGFFFLKEPPIEECKIADFRTVDSISVPNPSRNLIDTVDLMSNVQEWMAEYNKDNGISAYAFVGSTKISDGVVITANAIRAELELSLNWFGDFKSSAEAFKSLRNSIMNLGVLVMMNGVVGNSTHRTLNVNEFRAFTLIDPYAPLIFINSKDSVNGKLFSLLHELVHVWIGQDNFYNDRYGTSQKVSREEQFCNAVAAEILVPTSLFSADWSMQSGDTESIINALGKRFICSRFVLLRKALDTCKIGQAEYEGLLKIFQKQFRATQDQKPDKGSGGGDFYRTLRTKWDRRFIQALYASAQSGRTQYRDVYRLTNTTGKTFHELVERMGGI